MSGAAPSGVDVKWQVVGQDDGGPRSHEVAPSGHPQRVSLPMREASQLEKTDPGRAAAYYQEAILRCLEATADPLDQEGIRRDLLRVFDRLSLVLKRAGLPAEALEEIDSAESLGLLDCQDRGVKGHREALRKRRESLRRALYGEPAHN
jgi:hypothetical protein